MASREKVLFDEIESAIRIKYLTKDERKKERENKLLEKIYKKSFSYNFPHVKKTPMLVKQVETLIKRNNISARRLYLVAERIAKIAEDLTWTNTINDLDINHCKIVARDCALEAAKLMIPITEFHIWETTHHPMYQGSFAKMWIAKVGNMHMDGYSFDEVLDYYREWNILLERIQSFRCS
jgi:hypothetical protein